MQLRRFHAANKREEKGQSLVEFALTFSVIILVLSGVIDFGRIFFTLISLNDAAQEGAMYGSMNPTATAAIETRVRSSSTDPINLGDTDDVDVNVVGVPGSLCAGVDGFGNSNGLKVTVKYDFNFTMPFLTTIVPDNILTLTGNSVHTILFPPCP